MSSATKQGTTIVVTEFQGSDWSKSWDVTITDSFGGKAPVPTFSCGDEAGARRIANLAFALITPNVSAVELRTLALAEFRGARR